MCLILVAHRAHPRYRLVVAANRDEFFARPTAASDYWREAPGVLAGKDLEKGGTWMGVAGNGRWSAVTNFRDGTPPATGGLSRGQLVAAYLLGDMPATTYAAHAASVGGRYHGFNLFVGDGAGLYYLSSHAGAPARLAPGIYGLSNGSLDAPWPKVEAGKRGLREALSQDAGTERLTESLLAILGDRRTAREDLLPQTGVSRDWEKALSAAFIVAPGYGTRASTVLIEDHEGEVHWRERSFGEGGVLREDRRYRFAGG